MVRDAKGRMPMLHIACEKGNTDLARFLSFEGASDQERDKRQTPLHSALLVDTGILRSFCFVTAGLRQCLW